MLWPNRRVVTSIAAVTVFVGSFFAPSAEAISSKAAVEPSQSGVAVTSVAAGYTATCALLAGGQVKCWGDNTGGQLGIGDNSGHLSTVGDVGYEMGDFLVAVELGTGRTAKSIGIGGGFVCAVLDNGALKCWGLNVGGRLGLGDSVSRGDDANEMGNNLPTVKLGSGRRAKAIGPGTSHTCAILDNGSVKCWGDNTTGQLGIGATDGDKGTIGDQPGEMGNNLQAVNLGTGRKAKGIASGYGFTCAVLDNGSVKCWGENGYGKLGIGDVTGDKSRIGDQPGEMGNNLQAVNLGTGRKAKAVGVGANHACALLTNGTVKCWGDNEYGQLGIGDITGDKSRIGDQPGEMGNNLQAVNLGGHKAKSLSVSNDQTCVVLDNNRVKCWGDNAYGQLGIGNNAGALAMVGDEPSEMGDTLLVDLGTGHTAKAVATGSVPQTCAILDDSTLKCWGSGTGALGLGDSRTRGDNADEMGDNLPAINLGVRVKSISVALYHSCAILEDSWVQCWGRNNVGQLGYGNGNTWNQGDGPGEIGNNFDRVRLGDGRSAKALSVGTEAEHTCAILDNGTIRCWGKNGAGQLGLGTTDNLGDEPGDMSPGPDPVNLGTGRTVKAVVTGDSHTCAILDNGRVKCWGWNGEGELGIGTTTSHGDSSAAGHEMGDALPAVDLGTGRKAKQLSAGMFFTCALLDNGAVKCWGKNDNGQLGYGDTANRGGAPGDMGNNLQAVDLGAGRKAKAITAGWLHACALLDNNTVKCWGANGAGQLGLGDTLDRGDGPDEMGNDLDAVELGTGRKAKAISAGDAFTCALLDNATVKCWGYNGDAELGLGDMLNRGDGPEEMGDYLPIVAVGGSRRVLAVSAGGAHACVLLDDRSLRCWGYNGDGELGVGDNATRGDGPGEMGINLKPVVLTG